MKQHWNRYVVLAAIPLLLAIAVTTATSAPKTRLDPSTVDKEWESLMHDMERLQADREALKQRFQAILEAHPASDIKGKISGKLESVLRNAGHFHFDDLAYVLPQYIHIESELVLTALMQDDTYNRYPAVEGLIGLDKVGADACVSEFGQLLEDDHVKRRNLCYVIRMVYGDELAKYILEQRLARAHDWEKDDYQAALQQLQRLIDESKVRDGL